jgi:dolichol-phosphate mannosyltransferase
MLISTVVPTYNESMNIIPLVQRLLNAAKDNYETEIIVVDDDSPDKTWEVVSDFAKNNNRPNVRVIRRINEKGLASAVYAGVRSAKGDIVSVIDADLMVPPEIISDLVQQLRDYDVAVASRYIKEGKDQRPKFRVFLSIIINLFIKSYLRLKVKDCTSCVFAAKKYVFNKIDLSTKGFGEYFIEFLYKCKKNRFKTREIPVSYEPKRAGGKSKSDSSYKTLFKLGFQYGIRTIKTRFSK